jgi:hypothetical protein
MAAPTVVPDLAPPAPPPRAGLLLLTAAALSVALWQVPHGEQVLYPFSILATWFHEMGHGLTALLLGGHFDNLKMFSDGSGVASWHASSSLGRLAKALVAAGGPLGPPIAGCALVLAGRSATATRVGLWTLGGALGLSVVFLVRSLFGVAAVLLWAVVVCALALAPVAWLRGLALQVLGVQACISTFKNVDYLFTRQVIIDGQIMFSDTGQIAEALWLPHWLWGALIAVAAAGLLVGSLWVAYRGVRPRRSAAESNTSGGRV